MQSDTVSKLLYPGVNKFEVMFEIIGYKYLNVLLLHHHRLGSSAQLSFTDSFSGKQLARLISDWM